MATLSNDQSNHAPVFWNSQLTDYHLTGFPTGYCNVSRKQDLLRTPMTQMTFFNQGSLMLLLKTVGIYL